MSVQPCILVVDDQPHVLIPLQYLVQTLGVHVLTATNGADAVELAIRHRPVLVLLDVVMPEVDGYEACRRIRAGWGDHPGRIWLITARGSNVDMAETRVCGAERCINKPFDPDRVLAEVRTVLSETPMVSDPVN